MTPSRFNKGLLVSPFSAEPVLSHGRAQYLRKNPTNAEHKLWHHLRMRQLGGHMLRRQQPIIGPYIVDLVCLERRLVVEVDGGRHERTHGRDLARTQWLEQKGYRVLRVWNNEVLTALDSVLEAIALALEGEYPPPQSSPARGEEGRGDAAQRGGLDRKSAGSADAPLPPLRGKVGMGGDPLHD